MIPKLSLWRRSTMSLSAKRISGDAMNGSLQLSEYPGDVVRLSCEKCRRASNTENRLTGHPSSLKIRHRLFACR
jgi:hypothetical protein